MQNWHRHIRMWVLVGSLLLTGHMTRAQAGEPWTRSARLSITC